MLDTAVKSGLQRKFLRNVQPAGDATASTNYLHFPAHSPAHSAEQYSGVSFNQTKTIQSAFIYHGIYLLK